MLPKGTRVLVRLTPSGLQGSYPAANWLNRYFHNGKRHVTLLECAPHEGTLDVLNVRDDNGNEDTIYDFNIIGN
jgi:hypothetical protein